MASRTRHLGLASGLAALWLVCASVAATTEPLACTGNRQACFDLESDGANITHVLVDSGCAASPSDFEITVDGEPVTALHTDDGPCESLPREVWFPLESHQDTARVCVSVREAGPEGIQVYGKAGDECIAGIRP